MSILSPTGHLGFTPIEQGSFDIGVSSRPDAIVADSGSCDIGPQPLGADEHCSPAEWQQRDLELMLLAARRLGVPMVVGSASDAGTDRGVNQYTEIIRELAPRHGLAPFTLATIFSEVSRDPGQRCTVASVASHAIYERASPFFEHVAGGVLDMTHCRYEQVDERTTRVTGFEFRHDPADRIKLEGAGKVGERAVSIAGIRDPYTIRHIDAVIGWARSKVEERWGAPGARYQLYYHVYGRDDVMGASEPRRDVPAHELCLVVEAVAPRWEDAEVICALGTRNLFYARLPEVRGTAGTAALMMDEVLCGKPGYEWTVNHVISMVDPLALTSVKLEVVGR